MPEQDSDRERRRLAELYAGMADGELQLLARDFGSLSPEAQDALQTRDLTPEVDLYAADAGRDVMEWDDLVMLRQFRDLPEALLAKGSLQSSGIDAVLVDDNIVRTNWAFSDLVGGIKLCVREQDEESALELLAQPTPSNIEVDGVGNYVQPACPRCHSLNISFRAQTRPLAQGDAGLGVPIPLKRERWKCNQCGHHWVDAVDSSKAGWDKI
jgi:hypothetical protein